MISRRQFFSLTLGAAIAPHLPVAPAPAIEVLPMEVLMFTGIPLVYDEDLNGTFSFHRKHHTVKANTGELLAQGWERGIARHAHEDPFMVKMT